MNDPVAVPHVLPRVLRWQVARALVRACLPAVLGVAFAASVPAHASGDGWWVSLGVYGSQPAAEQARSRLAGAVSAVQVMAFEREGRTLYRVASGPFADASALRAGLRDARSHVRDAFALPAAPASAAAATAETAASAPSVATDVGVEQRDATASTRDSRVQLAAAELPAERAAPARAEAPAAPNAAAVPSDDGLEGLRLDPATERLLRDDAALQRELERLSRGLPKGLGNEIQAAQSQGVSLREVHARTLVGPQSPSTPPPGYQLHRLHRDDAPPPSAEEDSE